MVLKLDEPGTVFKPLAEWQNGRTVAPEDLTDTHFSVLRGAKDRTQNAAIKARHKYAHGGTIEGSGSF